jgi:hypothetical protein
MMCGLWAKLVERLKKKTKQNGRRDELVGELRKFRVVLMPGKGRRTDAPP